MKILLVGTSGHNLGDDALAAVLVDSLRHFLPNSEVTVTSVNPGRLSKLGIAEFGVDRKSLRGWFGLAQKIIQSDLILLGGGTLIQDALGISMTRGMIPYIWQVTLLAKIFRKRLATVPIGIDELKYERSKKLAKQIFSRCELVLLRDEKAFALAKDLVGPRYAAKLRLSADPVFAIENINGIPNTSKPYIVISYVRERRPDEIIEQEIFDLINEVRASYADAQIILLSMDTRLEDELGIYKLLLERRNLTNVEIVSPSDFREALKIIRGAELVIAMRLHAMILALGHTRIVGISRTTKTDTLMREAVIEGFRVGNPKRIDVQTLINAVVEDKQRMLQQEKFVKAASEKFETEMKHLTAHMLANK